MLLIVAATAVKLVTRSLPSNETRSSEAANITVKVMKYTFIERTTSCSIGLPSRESFWMRFGWM